MRQIVKEDTEDIDMSSEDMLKLENIPQCVKESQKESYPFRKTQNNILATCLGCYSHVCKPQDTPHFLSNCAIAQDKTKNIEKHNAKYEYLRKKQTAHEGKRNIYDGFGVDHKGMSMASFDRDVIERLEEIDVMQDMMEMRQHQRHQNRLKHARKRKYKNFNK